MKITPGAAGVGTNPAAMAPLKAAYSATAPDEPATPTPPTTTPFLKRGTPPGFTASGMLSFRSALPVWIPKPGCVPSMERAGGTSLPGMNIVLNPHPRLVFSIPYRAALGVKLMPGGKCTPLMKRTVRLESGA